MRLRLPVRGFSLLPSPQCLRLSRPLLCVWPQAAYSTAASSPGITLRPYQEESIQAVLDYLRRGERRLGLSLATGAGKTVIFSQLIGRMPPPNDEAQKTLILVHRRELVEQAARHCRHAYPDKVIAVEMGSIQASGNADITVASVMSLVRGRLSKYDPSKYKLILVDEAHHIVAQAYLKVLKHFGLLKATPTDETDPTDNTIAAEDKTSPTSPRTPALVGVSATLSRFDGVSLGHAIDHIVYHKDYIDLIDEKWLSDVIFSTVHSRAHLTKVLSKPDGDFLPRSLSQAVNTKRTNRITVKSWLEKAQGRKATLGFCVDVAHAEGLTAMFREHGVDARYVTGKTSVAVRSQMVDAFRAHEFPVLLNVGVFTEGTDIPNIDCVLLARPTKSRNLLVQMIGRGMRLCEGKEDCHVIDMVSALQTGIMTVPTLFGLDPTVLLDGARVDEIQRQKKEDSLSLQYVDGKLPERVTRKPESYDGVTFREYDSVTDLMDAMNDNNHVRKMSPNAWTWVGSDSEGNERHVLSGSKNHHILIKDFGEQTQTRPRFQITLTRPIPCVRTAKGDRAPLAKPWTIAKAETMTDAVHAADTFAHSSSCFPRVLIDRSQQWRSKPATQGQLDLLAKFLPSEASSDPAKYTMDSIGEMLVRLRFGARGQFAGMQASKVQQKRLRQRNERAEAMMQREKVQVGPLSHESREY